MGLIKHVTKPRFVNKTHEVYHYIVEHPGDNEKEILKSLSHLTAPVVHASLKMLSEGGYVSKTETSELNKLNRRICSFKADTGKAYSPTYNRQAKRGNDPVKNSGDLTDNKEHPLAPPNSTEILLTIPTRNGAVQLSISEAHGVYQELKKIFLCVASFGPLDLVVKTFFDHSFGL